MCFKSIFQIPDLSYKWKYIGSDGKKERWMYQTELIVQKLNPAGIVNRKNYVIEIGYETEKESTVPLNKKKIVLLDIATRTMASKRYPDNHQTYIFFGMEDIFQIKRRWGKTILVPIQDLPRMDRKIERIIEKVYK
ncbi:hypothetical protein JNUCC83_01700 [Vagococcus sp. JNUCC 83]